MKRIIIPEEQELQLQLQEKQASESERLDPREKAALKPSEAPQTTELKESVKGKELYQPKDEKEQATASLVSQKPPQESMQPTEPEETKLQLFKEEEGQESTEVQLEERHIKQRYQEEAQEREYPAAQELASNEPAGEQLDRATQITEAVMEQEVQAFPCQLEDKQATEYNKTTRKEAMNPEGPRRLQSAKEEEKERESPASKQIESLHPYRDLRQPEKKKAASYEMPVFKESTADLERKAKELPQPKEAQEEGEELTEEVLQQPIKLREVDFHFYPVKEIKEDEQEQIPPPLLDQDKDAVEETQWREEFSGDEEKTSGAGIEMCTKEKKLRRRRRCPCRCWSRGVGRRPVFPLPPSTLFAGSAFVFSVMVLVFHFIKRKNPN